MKRLFIIGLLALTVSCVTPKHNSIEMNTERLNYFYFDQHNGMSQLGENYSVSISKDGKIHVVIDEGYRNEMELFLDDNTIFDELLTIMKTYNTDKYKANYQPEIQVYDGDSWELSYRYDSNRRVRSGGYMAGPDNYRAMHEALKNYFKKWRDCQKGLLVIDYFKFTCENNKGCDIEYTLERGKNNAVVYLRNAERGIDKTIEVDNDYLKEFQETANAVRLKSNLYDYNTSDKEATRCSYFVRYNTGDTVSGTTCHTQYPSNKVSAILNFFERWLNE